MADEDPGPAAPGWYADPMVRGQDRWWDGTTWTPSTRPDVEVGDEPESEEAELEAQFGPQPTQNWLAWTSIALAVASLLLNPFLLTSLGAIVVGILGVLRARSYLARGHLPVGLRESYWGIGIGVVGAIIGTWVIANL